MTSGAVPCPSSTPRRSSSSISCQVNIGFTWTPKVCKIMAFMAVILGFGLFFYILLGFR